MEGSKSTISIENPVRLINDLSMMQHDQYGNTPSPGRAELLFIQGMQLVESGAWLQAEEKLSQAKVEARKTPGHGEPAAIAAACLGWIFLHIEGAQDRAL